MDIQEKDTKEILEILESNPKDEEYLNELKRRIIEEDSRDLDRAAKSVVAPQGKLQSQLLVIIFIIISWIIWLLIKLWLFPVTWSNCVDQQTCYPSKIRKPKNLSDIITAVNDARKGKTTVRAVGSGHSYSNVSTVFKGGILLDPHEMDKVLTIDATLLKNPQDAKMLFAVESGITIEALNDELDKAKLALKNMGAYDGQTLAGAISTGTHGTGITLGPIASSVRAVVLVGGDGTVYHIEPSNGISDPEQFKKRVSDRILKQDDDWFNTVVVSMGCTGIIYSYIIEAVDAYYLSETRRLSSWETERDNLRFTKSGGLPEVLVKNRHYEVDINPYDVNNVHSCIIQKKNLVTADGPSGSRGVADWIAGILAGCPLAEYWLVRALNTWPTISPEIINKALNSLVVEHHIDKSYKILNLGAVDNVKAVAMELSYPVDEKLVDEIDRLLAIFKQEAAQANAYMAGPFSLRFVAASDAYLAPQQGRLTCMVELDMLLGITTGQDLLKSVTQQVQAGNSEVRVHWGLDLDTVTNDSLKKLYPQFTNWYLVYTQLNATGVFDGLFTKRLNISMGYGTDNNA